MNFCTNPDVLSAIRLVNIVILVIQIATPIILIISLMIDFASAVKSGDNDGLNAAIKKVPRKVAALVIIFLMPTFVNLIVRLTDSGEGYSLCLDNANTEKIDQLYKITMDDLVARAIEAYDNSETNKAYNYYYDAYNYVSKIKDKDKQKEYETKLKKVKDYLDEKIDEINEEFNKIQVGSGSGSVYISNGDGYAWPVLNVTYVSSNFGWRDLNGSQNYHRGIDIAAGSNCKPQSIIVSSCDGTVSKVSTPFANQCNAFSTSYSYGNHVKIICDDGNSTLYAHLYKVNVKSGDKVSKCEQIGIMGNTGHSYGTHLHYEFQERNTNLVNPRTKVSPTNMCK